MNIVKKISLATTLALVFTGCASTVVVDKSIPEPERATLYLVGESNILQKVDDKSIGAFGIFEGPKGTGEAGGLLKKELKPTAQIPPGERKITVKVPSTLIGNDYKEVTHNFESGKKYRVAYEIPDKSKEELKEEIHSAKDVANALSRQLLVTEITGAIPKE